jgi:hypothetical protein
MCDPCDPWDEPCPPCVTVCGYEWMYGREYVPIVPVGEQRSAFTVFVTPPTPFLLSEGEASTPRRGRLSLHYGRVSDERTLEDDDGNVYTSDGEITVASLEYVSPRIDLRPFCACLPMHLGASITVYTLNTAILDELRNFVEDDLFGSDQAVLDAHTIGGRQLTVEDFVGTQTELLGSSPMWKAKAYVKFQLPDMHPANSHVRTSFSLGVTAPAFGSHSESGNEDWQPEACFAWAAPILNRLRWTGAATVALPGGSQVYDALGLDHKDVVVSAFTNLEYWPAARFAMGLGISWNSAYTTNSGLPMDLDSLYVNFGLLYRISCRSEVHLVFSENPETQITTTPGADYGDSQKDSDFSLTLGVSFAF